MRTEGDDYELFWAKYKESRVVEWREKLDIISVDANLTTVTYSKRVILTLRMFP